MRVLTTFLLTILNLTFLISCSDINFTGQDMDPIAPKNIDIEGTGNSGDTDSPDNGADDSGNGSNNGDNGENSGIEDGTNTSCDTMDMTCQPPPLVSKPGVVTILLAMGDQDNLEDPLVDQIAARSVAEKMIQFASPIVNPTILLVLDRNHHDESPDDFLNLRDNLLSRYARRSILEPVGGLLPEDIVDYDIVWMVNPGYPLGRQVTYNTLLNFSGGIILSGDDMSWGWDFGDLPYQFPGSSPKSMPYYFDISPLTGLDFIDNGTSVICNGKSYVIDDNKSQNYYEVTLKADQFTDLDPKNRVFRYGNDIDNSTVITSIPGLEVLATAKPVAGDCSEERPVIVRHSKGK